MSYYRYNPTSSYNQTCAAPAESSRKSGPQEQGAFRRDLRYGLPLAEDSDGL
jgi:hypothetical protein